MIILGIILYVVICVVFPYTVADSLSCCPSDNDGLKFTIFFNTIILTIVGFSYLASIYL